MVLVLSCPLLRALPDAARLAYRPEIPLALNSSSRSTSAAILNSKCRGKFSSCSSAVGAFCFRRSTGSVIPAGGSGDEGGDGDGDGGDGLLLASTLSAPWPPPMATG